MLTPLSAFATPLSGDTLFGQLCWTLREDSGEAKLTDVLEGYLEQRPFAVVSDAMPAHCFPRPHLPGSYLGQTNNHLERKKWKNIQWIAESAFNQPIKNWLAKGSNDTVVQQKKQQHMHNTINRLTGTTGQEGFAPYTVEESWYADNQILQVYIILDETQIDIDLLRVLMKRIGDFGFGKDASTGLGKFRINSCEKCQLPHQKNTNAWLTLAPCAPQDLGYDGENSYWQPITRYGRHGNIGALNNPFKKPILLASTGSVFSTQTLTTPFAGQGLGGSGKISKTIPETVQQGYAPVLGICLPSIKNKV